MAYNHEIKGHYEIKGNTIYAKIELLTEKELKKVKNLKALGYELIPVEKVKKEKEKKELSEEDKAKAEMRKILRGKKNAELLKIVEKADKSKVDEYKKAFNEPSKDRKINKKTGKPYTKGRMGGIEYIIVNFPISEYPELYK